MEFGHMPSKSTGRNYIYLSMRALKEEVLSDHFLFIAGKVDNLGTQLHQEPIKMSGYVIVTWAAYSEVGPPT